MIDVHYYQPHEPTHTLTCLTMAQAMAECESWLIANNGSVKPAEQCDNHVRITGRVASRFAGIDASHNVIVDALRIVSHTL